MKKSLISPIALTLLVAAAFVILFDDALIRMVSVEWQLPEYQHAYLIPIVAIYLVWVRATDLAKIRFEPSWWGISLIGIGLLTFVLGELSAIWAIIWYAFLFMLWGFAIALMGLRAAGVIWAGLAYLLFMIPLPQMLLENLSGTFQLWSSQLGTAFVRVIGISIYLEGNVIDLGNYKLQVVDACSGLRYLFPLASFAFFCAYIFHGKLWQKVVIFLSAVPITIFMNSFRIAVTAVLVNRYGTGQAEGFLHYFEGWVIFVACIALLFLEMGLFALMGRRKLADAFAVEIPDWRDYRYLVPSGNWQKPAIAAIVLIVIGALGSLAIQSRRENVPAHAPLSNFPYVLQDWSGRDDNLPSDILAALKVSDYLISTYRRSSDAYPVELYVAYYDSQRTGASIHSPRACLPSGGWQMESHTREELPGVRFDSSPLPVNRVVISQGDDKALVYYWFMQRGRYLTNEYALKWFIVWDALTKNRTDGALVRVMTPISDMGDLDDADRRLTAFISVAEPKLYYFIPQDVVVADSAAGARAGMLR